jgi:ubiquinone/menaquinone biosynthesis C-methylase UbiE
VACVYGAFSQRLAAHARQSGERLHLVDVAPIQLQNARRKLVDEPVSFHHQDSTRLRFADGSFEHTVVFFLLHEQPAHVRRETIAEAIRVTRPGGKVIFVDYHLPHPANPLRYVMRPVLMTLEPFALDLWRKELPEWLPAEVRPEQVSTRLYGGGLYQRMVIRR